MREDTKPKRGTYVPPEPKFELSQYTIAQLYNAGLPKQILKSATGETFTIIMPKFHEGVWAQDMNVSCPDFHFSIIPPGTYYDEDGSLCRKRTTTPTTQTFGVVCSCPIWLKKMATMKNALRVTQTT